MKLKPLQIIIIILATIIAILFTVLVITINKKPIVVQERINYEIFKELMKDELVDIDRRLGEVRGYSMILFSQVEELKEGTPLIKRELRKINSNIKTLNDAYIPRNYSDSSANALLDRLSR
ncbi:MAG: hypothetical protein K0U41_05960 [Gammaproteobacteria bacterium]|nr:hypothetical protein [Gammaproteobacteria bacterium]